MSIIYEESINKKFVKLQLNYRQKGYLHPSFLMESRLLNAIKNGDLSEAIKILDKINKDQRAKLSSSPIRSLKNSLIASCTLFTRAIIQGNVLAEKAFTLSDTFISEIDREDIINKLEQLEYEMLTHFVNMVNNQEQPQYSSTINNATSFIHDNLLQNLNLKIISDHCYINASYLSHLFKKEVKLSIVQYINKSRVQEGKRMLIHTTNSISEIAMLLQYCNQSYFSAQFKIYEGITPKEYRNKHVT